MQGCRQRESNKICTRDGPGGMLTARGLAVFRAERLVFRDLDFSLVPATLRPAGEGAPDAVTLIGPNGSGKSTLLRLLAGFVRPAVGTVWWQEEPLPADPADRARIVTYIGHQDAVKPGLTAAENLLFDASWHPRGRRREAILNALEAVGLSALSALPGRMLSAGQKRRLALSRLMLRETPVWLLDEPTLGLDDASIALFGDMLRAHRARGGVVMAATHVPLPLPGAGVLSLHPHALAAGAGQATIEGAGDEWAGDEWG
ncbi:Heme exporter protein A [Granulibacter bethesdensis CGDNIH4]|nr:Heme exporter protein A [Granulibacter bethesdensis CGDNIH4]